MPVSCGPERSPIAQRSLIGDIPKSHSGKYSTRGQNSTFILTDSADRLYFSCIAVQENEAFKLKSRW